MHKSRDEHAAGMATTETNAATTRIHSFRGLLPAMPVLLRAAGRRLQKPDPTIEPDASEHSGGPMGSVEQRRRPSSQLLGASGQSRRFQVTLKLSDCASVQGAKVKVKSSVCDVEVSGLFDEVNDLGKRTEKESPSLQKLHC